MYKGKIVGFLMVSLLLISGSFCTPQCDATNPIRYIRFNGDLTIVGLKGSSKEFSTDVLNLRPMLTQAYYMGTDVGIYSNDCIGFTEFVIINKNL